MRPRSTFTRRLLSCTSCLLALLVSLAPVAAQAAQPEKEAHHRRHTHWHSKAEAVAALRLLREGGNLIFVRHAKTGMLEKDKASGDWNDCAWQRNLSPMGREASREMGEAFRLLNIPVGDVLSSPYCRCMDTARLAFDRATAVPDLAPSPSGAPGSGMRAAGAALTALLARDVPAGTNTVVVGHIFNALGALGQIPEEGESFVIRRKTGGEPEIVARVTMTQWGDLVRDLLVFGLDPADDKRMTGHGTEGHAPHHGGDPHAR